PEARAGGERGEDAALWDRAFPRVPPQGLAFRQSTLTIFACSERVPSSAQRSRDESNWRRGQDLNLHARGGHRVSTAAAYRSPHLSIGFVLLRASSGPALRRASSAWLSLRSSERRMEEGGRVELPRPHRGLSRFERGGPAACPNLPWRDPGAA